MKKRITFLFFLCFSGALIGCSKEPVKESVNKLLKEYEKDSEEEIGGDWHVWGIYDFNQIGDLSIVIDQVNDEKPQHIGYDIYLDGESLGALLCEIRCFDGGYQPEDMDREDYLLIEDYNGDGQEEIGAPLKNGDIMWYVSEKNEYGDVRFTFKEVQKAEAVSATDSVGETELEGATLSLHEVQTVGSHLKSGKNSVIRNLSCSVSGNYELKKRDDGRISFRDFDSGIGADFPNDLDYSNELIPGVLVLNDQKNSFMVIRSVTNDVHEIGNYRTPDEMLEDFFEEYFLADFELLFGETGEMQDYEEAEIDTSGSGLAQANVKVVSKNYDLAAYGTFHSSSYVNGVTGYVVKFCFRPSDGRKESRIWGRAGIDSMACERKVSFGMSGKNNRVKKHRYDVDGKYQLKKDKEGNWTFTDSNKQIGLKFPKNLETSNQLISDAVLVSDQQNGYVVARNMTSEYLDYDGSDEDFQRYLLDHILTEDFSVLYGPAARVGEMRFKYYDSTSEILCTGETRIQNGGYDINVRTDLLAHKLDSGTWCIAVLTRYSPYGELGHREIRNDTRILYMEPAKG